MKNTTFSFCVSVVSDIDAVLNRVSVYMGGGTSCKSLNNIINPKWLCSFRAQPFRVLRMKNFYEGPTVNELEIDEKYVLCTSPTPGEIETIEYNEW